MISTKKIILGFSLIFSTLCFSQLSLDKQKMIENLSKLDYAEAKYIGIATELSKIYNSFESIKNNLTDEDLIFLAKNSSNALRLYSSLEVMRRNNSEVVELYKHYKSFPLYMSYKLGCVTEKSNIADLMYAEFLTLLETKEFYDEVLKTIKNEKNEHDSMSIYLGDRENEIHEIQKIVTSKFLENFEKIKLIESEFKNIE